MPRATSRARPPLTPAATPEDGAMEPARAANAATERAKTDDDGAGQGRIAHTLTACCRCRTRKTRCDPGLPRCGPCERTNSHCEYYDPTKARRIPRNYVVHLQHKVRDLERQLADLDRDDEPDAEDVMRGAAAVRVQDTDESKFLGPSSGITITRLVMQLAKQFTESKTISEIVPHARQRSIKAAFEQEDARPTSKVYPLVSDVAAEDLPNRDLTNLLVELFYCKVHPMYPIFHEPTFTRDVEAVYAGSADPYQNYCLRMVIAISLQKMDTQYAGLADSYYLAALTYFEAAIKPMNLKTLQCFGLVAGYSLLTPTRTAVYYIIGLGMRLCQALGLHEEKTVTRGSGGRPADPLEVDMRRRLFWSLLTMDYGLSHSLGRPAHFAARRQHIDVGFAELVDDVYITREGIKPAPQASLKKWIGIHFYKMRLLQLEIRKMLYQRKTDEPRDDQHPWFAEIQSKIEAWRDTSPEMDGGSGLNKVWFVGRYNTMVVFIYRPSPQVPRPSLQAAVRCYDACQYNIYMSKRQIDMKLVDVTWIFVQSIFMCINTMLWTLSYQDVRRQHSREEVEGHLAVAMESIELASDRWPGVASAIELYHNLIGACMEIYTKDGDVPITANSPSDCASVVSGSLVDGINRSRTTSPATVSTTSVSTPKDNPPPFGYLSNQGQFFNHDQTQPTTTTFASSPITQSSQPPQHYDPSPKTSMDANVPIFAYPPTTQFSALPATFASMPTWNPTFAYPPDQYTAPLTSPLYNEYYAANQGYEMADYLNPGWSQARAEGLNQQQQMQLMHDFEMNETSKIEEMIQQSHQLFVPPQMQTF
ncbi:fungal-specific transcription factor domain-containing protein [Boeremia exigua]|uniref:fungal-specific transcription factor domain-containing protein n=1 Tax=Boeremia exigua TaxID=749465 RepID=UPI001E8E2722|nr:fungal-specific transcription factor domain-containing protein [Boeremia exigua]KAH6613920.1 fungal-specific transcription factor domain-containing protein [Boeremia exigua]